MQRFLTIISKKSITAVYFVSTVRFNKSTDDFLKHALTNWALVSVKIVSCSVTMVMYTVFVCFLQLPTDYIELYEVIFRSESHI